MGLMLRDIRLVFALWQVEIAITFLDRSCAPKSDGCAQKVAPFASNLIFGIKK
jgi:hypothetical protein